MTKLTMPLVPITVAFGTGVALASSLPARGWWVAWLATLALAAAALAANRLGPSAALLLAAVATLGALRAIPPAFAADDVARLVLPRVARVEGRIVGEPIRAGPDGTRFLVDVSSVNGLPRSGRIQMTIHGEPPPVVEDQRVAVDARLRRASGFRNPLGFDYAAFLARAGVHVVGTASSEQLEALDEPSPPWPTRVKRAAVATIHAALPPVSAALLAGLLLGDRTTLPPEILDAFRRAGVYHVLA